MAAGIHVNVTNVCLEAIKNINSAPQAQQNSTSEMAE